jgi:DNA-binding NtrC family response regulator
MANPRSANELSRLLHAADSPVYFVADDRKIVFVNRACAVWLGIEASDLQGRICRYRSGDADPLTAAADSLCPPPEVFHGRRTSSVLCVQVAGGGCSRRRAEFVPLAGDDGIAVGVLAVVETAELPEESVDGISSVTQADEAAHLHEVVQKLRATTAHRHRLERLAGRTPAMLRVRAQVETAAQCQQTVLIVGSGGSGKQHVAGTIHFSQSPPTGAIVPISCASLPTELLVSTLHALVKKQAASDEPPATLVLTDVQMMPADVQAEMAKSLVARPKNLRVIATSKLPLLSLVEQGTFRNDLAMLLSTIVIELPPLSARREDIPLVAQMLLEDCNADSKLKQLRGFAAEAMDRLAAYDWPGEIDELAGIVREAFALAEGYEITAADLPKKLRFAADAAKFPRKSIESIELEKVLAQIETELIERAMKQSKGNKSRAAKLLGLTRPRLYRRMVQLGLAGEDDGIKFEPEIAEATDDR